jgi:transcriptional regulator with XRE-family HTH domain
MAESIGKRIAFLRQKNGWTQQSLANRLAMSRVAISHIEMDLSIPSERSITLMAGIFKLSPFELVDDTTYPKAKLERLPELTTIYTDLELQFCLLNNDTEWLSRMDNPAIKINCLRQLLDKWLPQLENWNHSYTDEHDNNILLKMRHILDELKFQGHHPLV